MRKITLLFFVLATTTVHAQELLKQQEAMTKLSVLEGNWVGNGWVRQGQNQSDFKQTEEVVLKLNGTALLIEGKGYDNDSLAFNALAVATFDVATEKYVFNSHLSDGRHTTAEGWFDETGLFHWQFEVPNGGMVRYTITIKDNSWHEEGKYSPKDVDQWYPFMAMDLNKLK